ncbi:MAG: hypothetical protein JF612_04800 [Planctomycetia bacterium]|nr:hypothetical protein [Planctomycetia bacterium]
MASVRIHRQSCELGRLPPVCICCGYPATHRPRHRFYFQRPPGGGGLFTRWIASAVAAVAAVLGTGVLVLVPWARTSRWRDAIEFPVPLCDAHRRRLQWPDYFLWGLLLVALIALAVLLSAGFSQLTNHGDDTQEHVHLMESALSASVTAAAVLIALRVVLWLTTVRVSTATTCSVDMAAVAPEFVEALHRAGTGTLPGYIGQSMGVPLPSGAGGKDVGIVGAALLLVSGCCLLGYVGRASTIGTFKQHAARIHAEARSLQKKVVAEAQKRLAEPEPDSPQQRMTDEAGEGDAAPAALPAPLAETLSTATEAVSLEDPPANVPAASAEPLPPKRLEEFKIFGRERIPPHSREIRDIAQLQAGMEVWASAGLMWYRSTVVRVENRMLTRIRFQASAHLPERLLPAAHIRLPEDGDGGASP